MFFERLVSILMATHIQRVAHRGGSRLAPENTLAAFRNALTLPIDAIELDVQMSRDGHAIVFHDETIERLTNGVGNILDLDFSFLRSLNAATHFSGGWPEAQQIPTLREVLNLAKNRVQVYVEIKSGKRDGAYVRYPHIVEMVVQEIRAAAMLKQVLIISFDWQALSLIKELEPALPTGANVSIEWWASAGEQAPTTLLAEMKAARCDWVNVDGRLLTLELVQAAHGQDLKLGAWTVDSLEELRRFAVIGADSLTSDRPNLFAQL
jgi:glycerophosphoryl diester phosphodiesterase